MNQDFQSFQGGQGYEPYQFSQPPVVKNAAYFRQKAREALTGKYWSVFAACFVASLLGGIVSQSVSVPNVDFDAGTTVNVPLDAISPAILTAFLIMAGAGMLFSIAFSLFVGGPVALGFQRFKLDVIDGKLPKLDVLFAYFKKGYGKSVLARLLYDLISFATSLPLLAVTLLTMFPSMLHLMRGGSPTDGMILQMLLGVMLILLVGVATVAVQVWIIYRYAFVSTILAEYPEIGVIDAFRSSANLMRGNKWRLFCLQISFIGWVLLAACCTCGIGILFLNPYTEMANIAFYHDIARRDASKDVEFPSLDPNDYNPDQNPMQSM